MHMSKQYKARLNLLSMFLVLSLIWSTQILLISSKDRVLNLHHQHACDKSRTVLTEPEGKFSSGPAGVNYTQDSHCEWLIKAKNSSQFITLTFHSLGTECSYDYIYVYDGESFNSTLLGTLSGKIEPQNLVAKSGNMLVLLYSDTNYVLDGFNASYIVSNCLNSCHHRGKCVNHQCVCLEKWLEPDCKNLACPENCGEQLGYGKCENGTCICKQGYSGRSCDLSDNPNGGNWRLLATYAEGLHPRAAHTAVYVESFDSLYVFGGYDLNNVLDRHQVYRFKKGTWEDAEVSVNINTSLEGNNQTDTKIFGRPSGRYGHAAAAIPNGFTMFGGKLANGSLTNELWIYNVTGIGGLWSLRALNSHTMPPALTRHTITMANSYLYVFGGSLENGEFSSSIYRIKCSLEADDEQWEKVHVRGGKALDVRIVAHSTIYYKYTNSLIVYGGITASVARFSKLSDKIFAFQLDKLYWSEFLYPRTPLRDYHIPRERAFHSTVVAGNYLIVFGGYTHRHKKEEICYDNQMYLYHLGCHTWVKQDVLGVVSGFQYPKKQGVFAHAAAIRKNNTLLIVGGYHGNMNADLFAYELPLMFRASENSNYNLEIFCKYHQSVSSCISDPECGWCPADSSCYGRTSGATCTTNLQTTRCPGICPSLGDCHSCLIHGTSWEIAPNAQSVSNKLGLNKCAWCVQNARCHHKEDSYGVCGEDTPSHEPGWWGKKGTDVFEPHYCAELDHLPGLTFVKYYHPTNWSMPDFVSIVNATMVDFTSPIPTTHTEFTFNGEMIARLLGFVRPRKTWKSDGKSLHICSGFSSTILRTKVGNSLDKADLVLNTSTEQSSCYSLQWPSFTEKFLIDFQAKRKVGLGSYNNQYQHSKMELQHWSHGDWKAFTFEYLEPYSRGFCSQYTNCLQCLTDSLCGWCDLSNKCISRKENETKTCWNENEWKYIIIQPDKCPNCTNFITCEQCISTGLCEWWVEDARCARLGRSLNSIKHKKECPASCNDRKTCSECLTERGRCVWCEATSQCFSFAVYTSEYQFGICREWLDQTMSQVTIQADAEARGIYLPAKIQQCKSCAQHKNCSSCLRSLSCGWCYDRSNPVDGHCLQGNFNHSISGCEAAVNSLSTSYDWAYAQCPDIDECEHAIHNCHMEATCTNTYGSFECYCRRGFTGDGRRSCIRSCYEHCIHGYCSGPPDYVCKCDLGWTGIDCSIDCGCHNHSSCMYNIGKCDSCQNMTDGETCERCRVGSYGNATSIQGCKPCECNSHGDEKLGICDVRTGECFCKDNTGGEFCEKCIHPYYGDPQGGEECYYQCSSRAILTKFGRSGIGSRQLNTHTSNFVEAIDCLWFVTAPTEIIHHNVTSKNSLTVLEIDILDFHVFCDENAVYVFEGWPSFDNKFKGSHFQAVLCSPESSYRIFESRSDLLSVHYKQGRQEYEFKAIVTIKNCGAGTCTLPHICDSTNRCVCPNGYLGPKCEIELCPKNCYSDLHHGYCDQNYGRCVCSEDYGDIDCGILLMPYNLVVTELFDTRKLSSSFEHLKKTIPRFGHSLNADKRGFLWMFGGFSLSNGALNDIRQFDTKNGTWIQVTVDSLPEAIMPQGRYFHAAEIVQSKQSIYLYGGLTRSGTDGLGIILGDFWKFGIKNQNWEQIQVNKETPGVLAGHTLTFVRYQDHTFLLLIGGVSNNDTNDMQLWEFSLEVNQWQKLQTSGVHIGKIYGHSTVYHKESQMVYVFGGISSRQGANLFAFDYKYMRWIEIPRVNVANDLLPTSIIFHSAVSTQNFMLIYGGQIGRNDSSDVLIAYNYECNQWIRIFRYAQIVGKIPSRTYAASMITGSENNVFYIIGGWDGSVETRVIQLKMPHDICDLWSFSKYFCRQNVGCSFCAGNSTYELFSHCFSHGNIGVCQSYNGSVIYNYDAFCRSSFAVQRNCSSFRTCTSCLDSWAQHAENGSSCKWCQGCHNGDSCIPTEEQCAVKSCNKELGIKVLDQCKAVKCSSLTCQQCIRSHDCAWVISKAGWTSCLSRTNAHRNENVIINTCPIPCSAHLNCTTCLSNNVSQNNLCKWSTLLKTCIYRSLQPLYCAGGICGLLLEPQDIGKCSGSCTSYTQCSHCLMRSECGWCSKNGKNGEGFCLEGSSDILFNGLTPVTACHMFESNQNNGSQLESRFTWNYLKCPYENECENGHHSCNRVSEICVDHEAGYRCECGPGYTLKENECIPVCNEGCVHGTCIQPNVCKCNFGYVGFNCTIQCQCNGHSQCHGPDNIHDCIQCQNNTVGLHCEKCKPLYVGDPKNNGTCFPCLQYCNGHSDVCINRDSSFFAQNMSRNDLETNMIEGPVDDAICLRCANQTSGDRCQDCIEGFFRGSENFKDGCRACECNGHGDRCDTVTGENCNCGNNTEMDGTCSARMIGNSAQLCWKAQCSKCKHSFLGNPTDGHQCYKRMYRQSRMTFDAKPTGGSHCYKHLYKQLIMPFDTKPTVPDDCKTKPSPLQSGKTAYFVIEPELDRNVMTRDIRIIVDITQGNLDVFISPQEDSFVVYGNQTTGNHIIYLDHKYRWVNTPDLELAEPLNIAFPGLNFVKVPNSMTDKYTSWLPFMKDCPTLSGTGFLVKDVRAANLSTLITLKECNTVLRGFGIQNRLTVVVPRNSYNSNSTRFFIVLRGSINSRDVYGIIVFMQDYMHINLFMIFSVLISFFLLFSAVCIVAWKANQAANFRRAQRQHNVEMGVMARRPHASVSVVLSDPNSSPTKNTHVIQSQTPTFSGLTLCPVAIEPTQDNNAAVATVLVLRPGNHNTPIVIALGSVLIRHNVVIQRSFLGK